MKEKDPALQCVFFRKNERHTPLTYGGAMGLIEVNLFQLVRKKFYPFFLTDIIIIILLLSIIFFFEEPFEST